MKKAVKKAVNFLQTSYSNGLILYPRVDNSLVYKKTFDFYPHPQFERVHKRFKPLGINKYRITKENSLLFLSVTRAVTPSNIEKVASVIDDYFDDDLQIKPEMLNQYNAISRLKKELFQEEGITNSDLHSLQQTLYREVSKQKLFWYKLKVI